MGIIGIIWFLDFRAFGAVFECDFNMVKKTDKNILPKNDSTYEERLMVLVENLGDQIKLVAEDNLMTREMMERGFERVNKRFDSMENRMDRLEIRFDNLEAKVDNLEAKVGFLERDMHSSYKTVIEYLSRIEGELAEIKAELKRLEEKKADKETLAEFEKRIIKIEREIVACKSCRQS